MPATLAELVLKLPYSGPRLVYGSPRKIKFRVHGFLVMPVAGNVITGGFIPDTALN